MKRKILFITPSLRQGGVEQSLITALKLLDPDKYEISLFLYVEMLDLLSEVPEYVNVIVEVDKTKYFRKPYCIYMLARYNVLKFLKRNRKAEEVQKRMYEYIHIKKVTYPYRKVFKNRFFDVLVSYSLHIGTEMGLYIPAEKRFVFMHSSDPDYHKEIIMKDLPQYDRIVAVSPSIAAIYEDNYPALKSKITFINNYIDAVRINELSLKNDQNAKNDGVFTITTCGRISHEKGFDLAVEAAEFLKQNDVPFRWLFIGDGDDRTKIEDMIVNKGLQDCIEITGFQENPYSFMAQGDIYVQTSYEEAQPLVLLEAMVLGKPIVSTKTVGGQYILDNGNKGVLTGFSGKEIGEAVLNLIQNPALRKQYGNRYTLEDNLKEKEIYIQKWNQLLE